MVKDLANDFHTKFGRIKKSDLKKSKAKTNTGLKVSIFDSFFIDKYEKKKRGAQIIVEKDIGQIIANTGIGKDSVVIDAGSGSGALACFLANIVKHVYTFDNNAEHVKTAKANVEFLGLKNVEVKNKDVYKGFGKKNADLLTLDLKEPWLCLKHAHKALKQGGFMAVYSPQVTQVQQLINTNKELGLFIVLKTIETTERAWKIEGQVARPEFTALGHTGFLTFMRKI
ncbi:methyltransferase domain-containing protein [Candidatus Woesearchaeota archaeon]|nr:methyltransferase domain-containing protein [Candidatus Woesearchaeota archaeon]